MRRHRLLRWVAWQPRPRAALLPLLFLLLLAGLDVQGASALSLPQIYRQTAPAVVLIQLVDRSGNAAALGSGFVVSPSGVIVTNHHVIEPKPGLRLVVKVQSGDTYDEVWVIHDDTRRDFAVLSVKAAGLPVLGLGDSDKVEVGEQVVALGNPKGLERTYTEGIVSAIRSMPEKGYRFIQHQAPISPGSSGGPLLNTSGEVIGINTFFVQGGQNLNGAVPINYVKPYLQDAPSLTYEDYARTRGVALKQDRSESAGPNTVGTSLIRIATHSPLSGGQAVLGEAIKLGAQLAAEVSKGAIENLGFRVEVVAFDDQATPAVGVANARRLVADPDTLLVIGHLNSGVTIPSSEVYRDAQLAVISPANTNPVVTDRGFPNMNRVIGRDDVEGVAAAVFVKNQLKARSAYVIHDRTQYGQGVAEFFRAAAVRFGIDMLGFEGTSEKSDFGAEVSNMKAKNPDVVYFGGIYLQAAPLFKQARDAGIRATFFGPDGMDSSDLVRLAGRSVVGLHYTAAAGPASASPGGQAFVARFQSRFGRAPEPYAAEAYDATVVGLQAIEAAIRAGGGRRPTRSDVAAAIRRVQAIQGVTGVIEFDEKGDRKSARYYIIRVESPDPSQWGRNRIVGAINVAPPTASVRP
jgi:branched-chain amino acid transport system substrate-binding protein